jgi:hypothetical protein
MLKRLSVLTVFLATTYACFPAPGKSSNPKTDSGRQDAQDTGRQQPSPSPPIAVPQLGYNPTFNDNAQKQHDKDGWDKAAVLSNYLLVLIGIAGIAVAVCTLLKLERQTKATEVAAESSLKQANHIITSERAWMTVVIESELIPPEIEESPSIRWTGFSIQFVNQGKTPALLIEAGCHGVVQSHATELPDIQPPTQKRRFGNGEVKDFRFFRVPM